MGVVERHNVHLTGPASGQPIVFAHGFGCDQNMWRYVAPRFEDRFRVVLFDHVGAGNSDLAAYDAERHSSLGGYAKDVLELCRELELRDVIFVGHSVSAMIGVLAANEERRASRPSCSWARRRAISTTETTLAASASPTSTSCSARSTATISVGRALSRR